MKMSGGIAALVGVLVLVCAVVAWEWYTHIGKGAAPQPVQQIAAVTQSPTTLAPSASPTPVTYVPVVRPTASATPAAPAALHPMASGTPVPTATPGPTATPYSVSGSSAPAPPAVAVTLAPHAVTIKPIAAEPDSPPEILSMTISTPVAHGGEVVSGTVETSSNVASVEAKIAGYSSAMQKVGVGKFVMTYRVPNLPFFLHRTYRIEVIARNTRGDAVSSSVPITIR